MTCRTIATAAPTVRRTRRARPPLLPRRQVRLLDTLLGFLLSCQVPVDFAAQIGGAA